jgi:hypothetical protein
VVQSQRGLDQPGGACSRFEVPDVRLDRADRKPRAVGAEDRPERRGLDGVADRGPGPVSLGVLNRGRLEPGVGEAGAKHVFLGRE